MFFGASRDGDAKGLRATNGADGRSFPSVGKPRLACGVSSSRIVASAKSGGPVTWCARARARYIPMMLFSFFFSRIFSIYQTRVSQPTTGVAPHRSVEGATGRRRRRRRRPRFHASRKTEGGRNESACRAVSAPPSFLPSFSSSRQPIEVETR